jgi:pimeloyl-ACP methyl ester carboxylesterase
MRRLVLVHGSVTNGAMTWGAQRALADRWELVVLDRPGFSPGPAVERVDFEQDAAWLAERLEPGDHLCGHSYGGVVCLLAAAQFRELGTLTAIEPPATRAAAGDPAADVFAAGANELWRDGPSRPGGLPAHVPESGRFLVRAAVPASAGARAGRAGPPERARAVGGRDPGRRAARSAVPEAGRLRCAPRRVRRDLRRARARPRGRADRPSRRGALGPAGTRLQRGPGRLPRARGDLVTVCY